MKTNRITLIPAVFVGEKKKLTINFMDLSINNKLEQGENAKELHTTIERNIPSHGIIVDAWGLLSIRCSLTGRSIHFLMPVFDGTTVHAVNNNEWLALFDQADSLVNFKLKKNIHLQTADKDELAFVDGEMMTFSVPHTTVELIDDNAEVIHCFHKGSKEF